MDVTKLATIIKSHGLPLGMRPHGEAWTMSALHPAHPSNGLAGVPDNSCVPTAMVEFRSTYSLTAPAGTTNSWGMDIGFLPNVCVWGTVCRYNDATPSVTSPSNLSNTQVANAATWRTYCNAARLAYYGVTVFVDTPALYDQGTLVATQVQQNWATTYNQAQPYQATYSGPPLTYDSAVNLPGCVVWPAREGVYFPMRLNAPSFPWVEQATTFTYAGVLVGSTLTGAVPSCLGSLIGMVFMRNLAAVASVRVTVRMGVEVQSPPSSPYSPFLRMPCGADPTAISSYFALSSRLQDAYPSEFNDFGKLWEVMKRIGFPVLKGMVKSIPVIGPTLVGVGEGIASASKSKRVTRNVPSPAQNGKRNGKRLVKKAS